MQGSAPKTWVEVSRSALVANARGFRKRLGKAVAFMAVVKANAYGHGLRETVAALKREADWFGVDNLDEAAVAKKTGGGQPILALGFTPSWRMKEAARLGVRVTIGSLEQLKAAKAAASAKPLKIHLKIETGTTRQGLDIRQLPAAADLLRGSKRLELEGLSTHYANIEDTDDHAYAALQLERFTQAAEFLDARGLKPPMRHTACTAAAALFPDTHFNLARVGIGLYGLWPSEGTRKTAEEKDIALDLRPALAWKTTVAQVKEVKRGTPVSYGLTETVSRDSRVAVLGVGYWDGFDRGFSSVGEVLIRGRRAKVLGRVCMNMCMVDVTDIPNAKAEDVVTLIGEDRGARVTAEELAAKIGTINYEIVTRINPLTPRITV